MIPHGIKGHLYSLGDVMNGAFQIDLRVKRAGHKGAPLPRKQILYSKQTTTLENLFSPLYPEVTKLRKIYRI